jgi:hypothetical protein
MVTVNLLVANELYQLESAVEGMLALFHAITVRSCSNASVSPFLSVCPYVKWRTTNGFS